MSGIVKSVGQVLARHPILKGMVAYATIWPTGCLIQQTIAGKRWHNYDWNRCLRFGLYGTLFVAPTLYGWIRVTTLIWPRTSLKTAIQKALLEQVSYGPSAMCCFFFAMEYMETFSLDKAVHEVKVKFLPTWQVALCFWPIFQTINFAFVPERNRVPVISIGSLMWTIFLAYMKQLEETKAKEKNLLTHKSKIPAN